ncbi:hypothetical protein MRX96_042219 [Rhipicephalus microplus]
MLQLHQHPARRSHHQKGHGVIPVSSRTQMQPALLRGPASKEHRNMAMAQEDPGSSPSARSITRSVNSPTQPTLSEGTLLDDAGGVTGPRPTEREPRRYHPLRANR